MRYHRRKSTFAVVRSVGAIALLLSFTAACASATASNGASQKIVRNGEGGLFYRSIEVPAGATTLYLSGHVPPVINENGTSPAEEFGSTEQQATGTLASIKNSIEEAGWTMGDIVSVRIFLLADPATGKMDFAGFNRAYAGFFGTAEQPNKPVRALVEVAGLARPGWLVEIEVTAARVP